jgi:hypothetical protein
VIRILNEKFVPYAPPWGRPQEKWFQEAWGRYWNNTAKGGQGESGALPGTDFIVTTSAGRSLSGRVHVRDYPGPDKVAQALRAILDAYAKLPEAERRAKSVPGEAKPLPPPPPGGLVLTIHHRILQRDQTGQYRALVLPGSARLAAPVGQRDCLWLTAEECQALIPRNPRKGDAHKVPAKLTKRICLFGMMPNVLWFEVGTWPPTAVRAAELQLTIEESSPEAVRMRVHGSVLLVGKTGNGENPNKNVENRYDANLEGVLVYNRTQKKIASWDLAALGDYTGEWYARGTWKEATAEAPLKLGFSFELDPSDYEVPAERRRPPGYWLDRRIDNAQYRQYYWDPEKWEADWKKGLLR